MKKTFQFLALVALIAINAQLASAQSKPGCDPKACGPEHTKVEEAKVITDLRVQLQASFTKLKTSNFPFDKNLVIYQIPKGATDEESIMYLIHSSSALKNEIIKVVPNSKLLPEVSSSTSNISASKQQLIGVLKKDILSLEKQINSL